MFAIDPSQWFTTFPAHWAIFLISMIPITELNASIPIGLEVYKLSVPRTLAYTISGNMVPAIALLLIMPRLHEWIVRQRFIGNVVKRYLERAEKVFSGKYATYGSIALILFIALPGPFTGVWTASLAAFVFNIPFKKAFPLITIGATLAAIVLVLIVTFAGNTLRWIL